ncbi:MAG TPA: LytTR family DNA-binding domain-containing protein [Longimicrobiaceae bacterium]|jgi:two-component system LytT family response regulator|nr:LytTR family DNA-binding domain-containing protein [Longimicrobiaceae bacterium]
MSSLRCIIADDEPLARELTASMLRENTDVEIVGDYGSGRSTLDAIHALRPDLVLLDIQMPDLTGLEVAAALPREDPPAIVFVTAYDEFALRAFDLHAVDYLLKPFPPDRLVTAVERARERRGRADRRPEAQNLFALLDEFRVRGQRKRRLAIRVGERTYIQPVDEIEWIEADGKFVRVHAGKKVLTAREAMHTLHAELDPALFLRVSRSAIVNLDHVREIQPWFKGDFVLILKSGKEIFSTRAYRDGVLDVLGR